MANEKSKALPTREQLAVEDTWRLEDIYETDAAWDAAYQEAEAFGARAGEFRGTLAQGGAQLLAAIRYLHSLDERVHKLYVYAHLKYDQDTTNSTYQAMNGRIQTLAVKLDAATSYFTPELLAIEESQLASFLEAEEGLRMYRHFFEELGKRRPHVLPEAQEELLAQMSEVTGASSETFGMLNNADLKFPEVTDEEGNAIELTHGRYVRFLESGDQSVRKAAFEAMYDTYGSFRNTFASTLKNEVKAHNVNARLRRYGSAREAALANNNIPEAVYDNLLATVHDNLSLLHRYVALRKRVLEVDELHMYDLFTPLIPDTKIEVPYEEAKRTMLEGLQPLGEDYLAIVKEGLDNRWVDVQENKGKRSGAYSSGAYGTNPYILMNWQDNINNLFTLAHEFGHSVHSYLSRKTQPYVYSGYSIFVAEVASTVNEALLNAHLLKTTEDVKKRVYLLNHWLDGFRSTVFRQSMFAEFEHRIHKLDQEGTTLTAELLTEEYYALNRRYFGDAVISDDKIGLEWARIPHFYYNYYVYQYATGFSAAVALSEQILTEGQPAVDRYIGEFLKAGNSDYPIEVLKRAGVDMESPAPVAEACRVFGERLDELETLLDQMGAAPRS